MVRLCQGLLIIQVVAGTDPLRFRLRHLDDERLAAVAEAAARRFGWRPVRRLADRLAWRDGRWLWRGAGLAVGLEKAAGWRPAPKCSPTGPARCG